MSLYAIGSTALHSSSPTTGEAGEESVSADFVVSTRPRFFYGSRSRVVDQPRSMSEEYPSPGTSVTVHQHDTHSGGIILNNSSPPEQLVEVAVGIKCVTKRQSCRACRTLISPTALFGRCCTARTESIRARRTVTRKASDAARLSR